MAHLIFISTKSFTKKDPSPPQVLKKHITFLLISNVFKTCNMKTFCLQLYKSKILDIQYHHDVLILCPWLILVSKSHLTPSQYADNLLTFL